MSSGYRIRLPPSEDETSYYEKNLESRKRANKIKNYQSRNKNDDFKKHNKNFDFDHNKNYVHKKRSETNYPSSKNFSRKPSGNNKRNNLNNKAKINYGNYDYNSIRSRERDYNDYSNSKKHNLKSKKNIKNHHRSNEDSFNERRYSNKSKINTVNEKYQKNESKRTPKLKYSVIDHIRSGEDEEEEYYTSEVEEYNTFPNKDDAHGHQDFSDKVSDENGEISENEYEEDDDESPKNFWEKEKNISIITRSMWDSEPGNPANDNPPQQPFNHINYVDTSSPMCHTQEDCVDAMRLIKERDESLKYNFYIGGDGFIYEGKGWIADVNEKTGYGTRALDVAFIGTFSVVRCPPEMLYSGYLLINAGIENGKILKPFSTHFKMCLPPETNSEGDSD